MQTFRNKTALITGASAGIGEAFARQLAAAGCHLILVARREDRLTALQQSLQADYGVQVTVLSQDLAQPGSARALFDRTQALNLPVDLLINNAGFAQHGYLLEVPLEVHSRMIQLMVTTLTELTWLYGADMRRRGGGHILLVSSLLGFLPGPQFASYAGAKAFVLNFAESLSRELRPHNIRISALCPGGTATEFMDVSGQKIEGLRTLAIMSSDAVARAGLNGVVRGKASVVPGLLYKVAVFAIRFVPRQLQAVFGEAATRSG
ncbi:SDR family NAD(P)-dependent oxidoreductase [Thalassolituus sp. LLYu03]|uniref:SDR family NAD(P)-dependent oxidoreductase n=1 Tax=Thalassolituus sp. LLYu03 TaxID=3421656 RepID=UPI003D2DC534